MFFFMYSLFIQGEYRFIHMSPSSVWVTAITFSRMAECIFNMNSSRCVYGGECVWDATHHSWGFWKCYGQSREDKRAWPLHNPLEVLRRVIGFVSWSMIASFVHPLLHVPCVERHTPWPEYLSKWLACGQGEQEWRLHVACFFLSVWNL